MHIINSKLIKLCEQFITKSTVDLETELLSENETDTESETEFLNRDDEASTTPEYDTEEPYD